MVVVKTFLKSYNLISVKDIKLKNIILKNLIIFTILFSFGLGVLGYSQNSNTMILKNGTATYSLVSSNSDVCGGGGPKGPSAVQTSIDFGCQHKGNGILDLLFAIIRFLSDGVGIIIVLSIIIAGIQYISSSGEPQAVSKAIGRIRSSIIALFVYIFAYAILNYLIPGTFLK